MLLFRDIEAYISYFTLNDSYYNTEVLCFISNLWWLFCNCINLNSLHLYIWCFYLCKLFISICFSIFYYLHIDFCKLPIVNEKAKGNVSNLAFFSLGWTPESSKMQTRSKGLKMPFPVFPDFFPTPLFSPPAVSPRCSFFSFRPTPY